MSPQNNQAALAALNGVRPVLAHFDKPRSAEDLAADIIDLWTGAERSLQALVGTSSLTGQQLIRAARQAEVITIDQAHSLLEFLAARDRANRTSYKPTQADGEAAVDGFKALEAGFSAPGPAKQASPAAPARAVYTPRTPAPVKPQPPPQPVSPYAPPSAGGGYRQPPAYAGKRMAGPPTIEMPGSFASAEAFLQAGAADTAGCLVLDINLPGLSGFQLQRQLMASGRKSPVIFITAHDDEVTRAEAGRIGSVAYFRKPFDGKVFLREIVRALKGN